MTAGCDGTTVTTVTKNLQQITAFLIQFRAIPEDESTLLPGRIEHVLSGSTSNFDSVEEVPSLLREMLRRQAVRVEFDTPFEPKP
jgi:hypothetical protein